MMPSKSKAAISWADEVENEEEAEAAAARSQVYEKQKLNPFGSARPREIVLQGRGIDWRILDENSPTPAQSSVFPPNEKLLKENIPVSSSLTIGRKLMKPQSRTSPKQKHKNSKMASYPNKNMKGPQSPTNDTASPFVPPLKYPPRALLPYLFPVIHAQLNSTEPFPTTHNKPDNFSHKVKLFHSCHNEQRIIVKHDGCGVFEDVRGNFEIKGPALKEFGDERAEASDTRRTNNAGKYKKRGAYSGTENKYYSQKRR